MSSTLADTSSVGDASNEPTASNNSTDNTEPSFPIKRRDFSVSEKAELLIKYDNLPKMSQSKAARELGVSKQLVCRLLQKRADIMQSWLHNKDTNRKRKRCGKDGEVETALKEWFDQACAEGAAVTGPIMRKKAEELAKELGKEDFVATDGWFSRWRKRENVMLLGRPSGEQSEPSVGQWPEMIAGYSAECVHGPEGSRVQNSTGRFCTTSTSLRTILPSPMKRRDLSISEKLQVLAKYDALPSMSQSLAASQLGISQPLLCRILKTRNEIEQESMLNSSRKRKRRGKEGEVETALKKWFDQSQKDGVCPSGPTLRRKAEELARELGKKDFVVTDGWFSRWRKRENINTRKKRSSSNPYDSQGDISRLMENYKCDRLTPVVEMANTNTFQPAWRMSPAECSDSNTDDVKPVITSPTEGPHCYMDPENNSSLLSSHPPDRVYSIEITEINLFRRSFSKGNNFDLTPERLSILTCVNLCGSKQKLLVVGQRDKRVSFRNVRQLPVDYYFNEESRITPHVIFDWLMKWDRKLDHEIVLMIDDCQDLRSITSFQYLKFIPVPERLRTSRLSRILHSQIAELKRQHHQILDKRSGSTVSGSNVQSTDFLSLLHFVAQSWENVPARRITETFIECGVLPGPARTSSNERPAESSCVKIEEYDHEDITGLVIDGQNTPPPTDEDINNALSVLSRAVHHRAVEFRLHYQYENFINSLLPSSWA